MATTTNYGWTTPDDTALVKDGAAAIRTLGSSVDTTTKALNPSTTLGDIEYRSSTANTNTRLPIGTTGQVLSVVGGVPAWSDSDDANAIQNAIIDAKGDLIVGSAADTPARLAVGTNDYVLTADSSATNGVKWAAAGGGGLTLISTATVSYGSSAVSFTSIPQTYKNLIFVFIDLTCTNSTTPQTFKMRPQGNNTAGNYDYQGISVNGSTASGTGGAAWEIGSVRHQGSATQQNNGAGFAKLYNYTSSGSIHLEAVYGFRATNTQCQYTTGKWVNGAITQVDFSNGDSWNAGFIEMWGEK